MSLIDEWKQAVYDLPFNKHQPDRNEVAHFCEHRGIRIRFSRARTTWHVRAPRAIRPWWLFLEPVRSRRNATGRHTAKKQTMKTTHNNNNTNGDNPTYAEVTENA